MVVHLHPPLKVFFNVCYVFLGARPRSIFVVLWQVVFWQVLFITWFKQDVFRKVAKFHAICAEFLLFPWSALMTSMGQWVPVSAWKMVLCINHYLVFMSHKQWTLFRLYFWLRLADTWGKSIRVKESCLLNYSSHFYRTAATPNWLKYLSSYPQHMFEYRCLL